MTTTRIAPRRHAIDGEPNRLCAIDVGSNSIHMVIAQADTQGALTTLWRIKEPVGLGRISFPSRKLSRGAIEAAIATLGRFKRIAHQRQCETICAVATSAVREAENGGDFIERCLQDLHLNVRVISAREEARLIYLGVRQAVAMKGSPHLMVDIGGGSVEFIVGNSAQAMLLESRKLGAARMTAQFIRSDPAKESEISAIRAHFDRELSGLTEQILKLRPVKFIGTSGTLESLAAMTEGTDGSLKPTAIHRPAFSKLLEMLIISNAEKRTRLPGLDEQRRDQILAGAMLLDELFKRLKFNRIELSRSAMREGILLDYLSRHMPQLVIRTKIPDPRRRSVLDLATRCNWHKSHSEHVATLTLQFFDQLRSLHKLSTVHRELIEYAALLHDIGWHISRNKHHKHSMYLVLHGDLKEFTPEEIAIIANIARYHRKSHPKLSHPPYRELSPEARRVVQVGAAILRLADGLDRSHCGAIRAVRCARAAKAIHCHVESRFDAQLDLWGARRKIDLFQEVFKQDIQFLLNK